MSQTTGKRQLKLCPSELSVTVDDATSDGLGLVDGLGLAIGLSVGDEGAVGPGLTETGGVGGPAVTGGLDWPQEASTRMLSATTPTFTCLEVNGNVGGWVIERSS